MTRVCGKSKTWAMYLSALASKSETLTMRKPMMTLGMKVTSEIASMIRFTVRSRDLSTKACFSYLRNRTTA